MHWSRIETTGLDFEAFLQKIRQLPDGQLWRHNQAGDLPGDGNDIDVVKLSKLVLAGQHTRGFTYTHYLPADLNALAIDQANKAGFTVNLSANNVIEADTYADLGIGPVVTIIADASQRKTPQGRNIVVCPAQTHEDITCATCQLCAVTQRKSIVGFLPHGNARKKVLTLAKGTQ